MWHVLSGAPRSDPGLRVQGQGQPVPAGGHVFVQRVLLPGRSVLLLHRPRGEDHQARHQEVSERPEASHLQLFRGLNSLDAEVGVELWAHSEVFCCLKLLCRATRSQQLTRKCCSHWEQWKIKQLGLCARLTTELKVRRPAMGPSAGRQQGTSLNHRTAPITQVKAAKRKMSHSKKCEWWKHAQLAASW